jgi:hypothetical protein
MSESSAPWSARTSAGKQHTHQRRWRAAMQERSAQERECGVHQLTSLRAATAFDVFREAMVK